jgi:hypothetical protein
MCSGRPCRSVLRRWWRRHADSCRSDASPYIQGMNTMAHLTPPGRGDLRKPEAASTFISKRHNIVMIRLVMWCVGVPFTQDPASARAGRGIHHIFIDASNICVGAQSVPNPQGGTTRDKVSPRARFPLLVSIAVLVWGPAYVSQSPHVLCLAEGCASISTQASPLPPGSMSLCPDLSISLPCVQSVRVNAMHLRQILECDRMDIRERVVVGSSNQGAEYVHTHDALLHIRLCKT